MNGLISVVRIHIDDRKLVSSRLGQLNSLINEYAVHSHTGWRLGKLRSVRNVPNFDVIHQWSIRPTLFVRISADWHAGGCPDRMIQWRVHIEAKVWRHGEAHIGLMNGLARSRDILHGKSVVARGQRVPLTEACSLRRVSELGVAIPNFNVIDS